MRGRVGFRSVFAAGSPAAATGASAGSARAASPPIAEVTAATPLSGGDGWIGWSVQGPGGWGLEGYHDGTVRQLPVAPRPEPFDASVGSDSSGAPVVTFSRCKSPRAMRPAGGDAPGGELVEPLTGSGCRVHVLPLDGEDERAPAIPAPARVSDTTPSMWRGVVTFARHAPAHGDVMQILSWSPRAPGRLVTLPHGAIPPQCRHHERGCRQRPVQGEVTALAGDGSIVAFVWSVSGGNVGFDGERELRVDRADGRRSTLVDGEIGHEACTGIAGGEHVLETVDFEPPFVSGRTAWFGELYDFGCFTGFATVLMKHGEAPGYSSLGKLEGVSLAVAQDDGQLYGLVAPRGESWDATDGPYCTSASPCAIEPLGRPTLKREERPPFDPVAFYSEI